MPAFLVEKAISLLDSAGITFRQNAISVFLDCPMCKKSLRLWFYKSSGKFKCFYCDDQFRGSLEYALKEIIGISIDAIRKQIYKNETGVNDAGFIELDINSFENEAEFNEEIILKGDILPKIKMPFQSLPIQNKYCVEGQKYLASRGVPLEVAVKYKMHYNHDERRVLFPVYQYGVLVGYQGRLTIPENQVDGDTGREYKSPKTMTYKGYAKEKWLMNADNIVGDYAVLSEGPFDCIKGDLCGNNVCSFGKAVSETQMQIFIDKKIKKLYLALDPDAVNEIEKIVHKYSENFTFYDLRPPEKYQDVGEMSFEEVKEMFDSAPVINPGTVFLNLKDPFA